MWRIRATSADNLAYFNNPPPPVTPCPSLTLPSPPHAYRIPFCFLISSHEFHKTCIKAWFAQEKSEGKLNRSCPMCRAVEAPKPKVLKKQRAAAAAAHQAHSRLRAHTHSHNPSHAHNHALGHSATSPSRSAAPGVRPRAATVGTIMPAPERKRGFFARLFSRGGRSRGSSNVTLPRPLQRQTSSFTNLAELNVQPHQSAANAASGSTRTHRALVNLGSQAGARHEHYRAAVWPMSESVGNEQFLGEGTGSERYQIRILAPGEPVPAGARLATASAAYGTIGMVLMLQGPTPAGGSSGSGSGDGSAANTNNVRRTVVNEIGSRPRAATALSAQRPVAAT